MLYRLNTKRLINNGIRVNKNNITEIREKITAALNNKRSCQVVFTGGPGCGKSTLARIIKQRGFLNIPKKQIVIVDDLRGRDNIKYRSKDLPLLNEKLRDKVLLLFDYKADIYLKKADTCILIVINEEERLNNLKKRSAWGYKKYKRRFYRNPPIPFTYKKSNTYICSGNFLDIFGY